MLILTKDRMKYFYFAESQVFYHTPNIAKIDLKISRFKALFQCNGN